MADRDPLRPDRARFAELRVSGETIEACAAKLGISRATAFRWLLRSDVRAALAEAQAQGREVAAGILQGHAARAAEVLGEALSDPDASVRVRAAGQVLDRVGLVAPPPEALEEGDDAGVLSADEQVLTLGGRRYVLEGENHRPVLPEDTDSDCEEDHDA